MWVLRRLNIPNSISSGTTSICQLVEAQTEGDQVVRRLVGALAFGRFSFLCFRRSERVNTLAFYTVSVTLPDEYNVLTPKPLDIILLGE